MLKDLITSCRSYRRFYQEVPISPDELLDMIDNARLTGSAANAQPLRYHFVHSPEDCAAVYPHLLWAAALKDWDGPKEGERPSAYIIMLTDLTISKNPQWDEGIAAQTIMLSAAEKGYGGCILASCQRTELLNALGIDASRYSIALVLALGKPKEEVKLVPVSPEGSTAYYRDENQVHYVPKRELKDILI
jgi:nitroreductase